MAGGSPRRSRGEGLVMNTGRTLFAQLMDFLPWSTFDRIVARYDGDRAVRKLSCAAQYQGMAFAQLTYRESLRDIEACLSAQTAKLYHMGFREPLRRSTLADANESRDWLFLTNQTALPALTICDLYKSRWQVDLFFKWIKQHLRIKRFYGTSENAVKT